MLISPVTTEDDQRMIETCLAFLKMLSIFLNDDIKLDNIEKENKALTFRMLVLRQSEDDVKYPSFSRRTDVLKHRFFVFLLNMLCTLF